MSVIYLVIVQPAHGDDGDAWVFAMADKDAAQDWVDQFNQQVISVETAPNHFPVGKARVEALDFVPFGAVLSPEDNAELLAGARSRARHSGVILVDDQAGETGDA